MTLDVNVLAAASVRHHHLHLVTFDKGFRRYLKPGRLTVLGAGRT
jgi:predicted nucleic acid-binding protein